MTQEFYSNGKLLISGEYAILDGALSLAVPTKYGQTMQVMNTSSGQLVWKSLDEKNQLWFEARYDMKFNSLGEPSNQDTANTLVKILKAAQNLNVDFLKDVKGCVIETSLDFPRDWGLGSSSTLINNIAHWAKVDAFQLLWNSFQGSGYDIACAQNNHPISYQLIKGLPKIEEVDFNPPFKEQLFFVHLNLKKNSREAIEVYKKRQTNTDELTEVISQITQKLIHCNDLDEFEQLMTQHEFEMSSVLGMKPVQERLFSDYFAKVKSLGAWGGDFILVSGNSTTPSYFKAKGFPTVIPFTEMVL